MTEKSIAFDGRTHTHIAHTQRDPAMPTNAICDCSHRCWSNWKWMNLVDGRNAVADWLVALPGYKENAWEMGEKRNRGALRLCGRQESERPVQMVKALGTRKAINTQLPFPLCHVTVLTFLTIHSRFSPHFPTVYLSILHMEVRVCRGVVWENVGCEGA